MKTIAILSLLLAIYIGTVSLYLLFFAFMSKFKTRKKRVISTQFNKIAVLIPAYKEDAVIKDVALKANRQLYPTKYFDVFVIADSLQKSTLHHLSFLPITVHEVKFEKSTKAKALHSVLNSIDTHYDIAVILDADNVMEPAFLAKINDSYNRGNRIIQGHRVAKNTNTPVAILDAISEEINNSIFRKGHVNAGFSSALIGSGMAFDFEYFKNIMAEIKAVGGFDKELELRLLKGGESIAYLDNALVYDEKVQKAEHFQAQRKRWLSAQFVYLAKFLPEVPKQLLKGNFDFLDKWFQMAQLPRLMLLGFTVLINTLFTTSLLFTNSFATVSSLWLSILGIQFMALFLAIPRRMFNLKMIAALIHLPKMFFKFSAMLFKLKGANKTFIHTQHGAAV